MSTPGLLLNWPQPGCIQWGNQLTQCLDHGLLTSSGSSNSTWLVATIFNSTLISPVSERSTSWRRWTQSLSNVAHFTVSLPCCRLDWSTVVLFVIVTSTTSQFTTAWRVLLGAFHSSLGIPSWEHGGGVTKRFWRRITVTREVFIIINFSRLQCFHALASSARWHSTVWATKELVVATSF